MNYTAAASWLVIVAIAMLVVSYLPRIAARVQDDRAARAARADVRHRATIAHIWGVVYDDAQDRIDAANDNGAAALAAAFDDAEAALEEAYAYFAAREAAQIDAEWEAQP